MKIALVGCGYIGKKRLLSLDADDVVVGVSDVDAARAREVAAGRTGTRVFRDWEEAVACADVETIIVSTTNDWLAPITRAAVLNGKNVLVEKPGARSREEIRDVIDAARARNVTVQVGFNHRYHPALLKAKEIVASGELGPLMFVRGRYGHGGRVGYDKEWRADPRVSGGGELLDQGSHLIDLARWFLGDFPHVAGYAATMYWNMPVEDNAFLTLRTEGNRVAWLHVSCSEWKNLFSFEIYGRDGKLAIDGLGGSYGTERLAFYKMLPQMGPPTTTIWEYPGADASWAIEYRRFKTAIREKSRADVSLEDAGAVLEVIRAVYAAMGFPY
jgi:predicted dehydrogenase